MGWIRVEEKIPEFGQSVLVWTSIGMCIAAICGETITGNKPTWIEVNGDQDFWNVTHWMPLPEPPTDKDHKAEQIAAIIKPIVRKWVQEFGDWDTYEAMHSVIVKLFE
jgi:hypothetical protein